MNPALRAPAAAPATIDAALATVRARGLRASSARRLVLEALLAVRRPVTAEEIAGGVGDRVPRSDLASVYRNLEALERIGLVRHLHAGRGPGRYVLARRAEAGFATCERCGELRAADPKAMATIRAAVHAALGYDARFTRFPIVGTCAACAGTEHTARAERTP